MVIFQQMLKIPKRRAMMILDWASAVALPRGVAAAAAVAQA
jgi:hypothetical protein